MIELVNSGDDAATDRVIFVQSAAHWARMDIARGSCLLGARLLITGQLMVSGDWQFEWMSFI
jgi:hypothetical protein